ncbi:uncharacterized protein LOC116170695 [Photinus pyralis]|uniref:uncharacterized protein LOC116170695 n=1 Tax=Photinus pyralis TaxID=7054 RepID=UPI0012672942|nr:uncharacterized protein LOC116170695 [Photinus pyralis]
MANSVSEEMQRIKNIISRMRTETDIKVNEELIDSVTKPGENWVGEIYSVKASRYQSSENLFLVIKIAPYDLTYRKMFNAASLFQREIYYYDKIIPECIAIQRERRIAKIFHPFPRHYFSSKKDLEEAIVMDDMRQKSFIVGNHRQIVDYETALLVMKTLGKFNALSFAIKEHNPDVFEEIRLNCEDNFLTSPPFLSTQIISTCGYGNEQIHVDHGVVTHGDPQIRNFLFKYNTASTIPKECCMIDMQIGRIGSPALDILFFMFVTTDKGLRRSHYKHLIEEYYSSLSTFLRELGCEPDTLLPFGVLQSHLRMFAPIGLMLAIWIVGLNFKNPEDAPQKDNLTEESLTNNFSTVNDERHFTRIKDLVVDMLDYGYEFC